MKWGPANVWKWSWFCNVLKLGWGGSCSTRRLCLACDFLWIVLLKTLGVLRDVVLGINKVEMSGKGYGRFWNELWKLRRISEVKEIVWAKTMWVFFARPWNQRILYSASKAVQQINSSHAPLQLTPLRLYAAEGLCGSKTKLTQSCNPGTYNGSPTRQTCLRTETHFVSQL